MKMDWLMLAVVGMLAFTLMNLLVKKVLDAGLSSEALLLYIFGIGAVVLAIYLTASKAPMAVTKGMFFVLLAVTALSLLGNVFLFRAIKAAPNPGYALAVNAAQILLITVASIFIFRSHFSWLKAVGTMLVVAGVVLLGL